MWSAVGLGIAFGDVQLPFPLRSSSPAEQVVRDGRRRDNAAVGGRWWDNARVAGPAS